VATRQQPAMHEVKEFAILVVYLYITLGAVILAAATCCSCHNKY
jgi:hypothetical protein